MRFVTALLNARAATAIVGTLITLSLSPGCAEDAPATVDPQGCPECIEGSLQMVDDQAKSCEVVLQAESGDAPVVVTFADGVTGRALTEGDRTGMAFVAPAAGNMPPAPVALSAPGKLTLMSSQCFGSDGTPLSGDSIRL